MRRIVCLLLGHEWHIPPETYVFDVEAFECSRCGAFTAAFPLR